MNSESQEKVAELVETPRLADALESEQFREFLDHMPIAIAVAELQPEERIVYVNLEFERLTGQSAGDVEGKPWSFLAGEATEAAHRPLGEAVDAEQDYLGVFSLDADGDSTKVDVWSNIIRDDAGEPVFRLLALADVGRCDATSTLEKTIAEQDLRLRELQHRVRNNLQMITALVRLEARNLSGRSGGGRFERLAGRIQALTLLYDRLDAGAGETDAIDLGAYLGQIATAVMAAHAVEGVHLDLALDSWPVKINVAMPTGLVLNEVLTNSLKHAFPEGAGRIRVAGVIDDEGCTVRIADDGVGLPPGQAWPQPGKLGSMIVHALRENAGARVEMHSAPGKGMEVTIRFDRARASA